MGGVRFGVASKTTAKHNKHKHLKVSKELLLCVGFGLDHVVRCT